MESPKHSLPNKFCLYDTESALQENNQYSWNRNCRVSINNNLCVFSDLKFSLGWCNNTLPYKIQFGLLLVSLGEEHELCQEVFFSREWIPLMQLTGEIVLLLPQLTKGGFVQHQNCSYWCFCLLHWDADDRGSVFFPPWHRQHHGCLLMCSYSPVVIDRLDAWLQEPFCLPQRKLKTEKSTRFTLLAECSSNTDLPLILQVLTFFRLGRNRFLPVFRADTKSLSYSERTCLRVWLLLECPLESTILRMEKDSDRIFKI